MESMFYKGFRWFENPEVLRIHAIRVPEYTINQLGKYDYTGLGPMCRIISGSGVFCGEYAYEQYHSLEVLMANGVPGDLIHPIWGTISAYLIELEMKSESRDEYVEYSFTFREADEEGVIPPLPSDWEPIV